jgi:hypothetical protein
LLIFYYIALIKVITPRLPRMSSKCYACCDPSCPGNPCEFPERDSEETGSEGDEPVVEYGVHGWSGPYKPEKHAEKLKEELVRQAEVVESDYESDYDSDDEPIISFQDGEQGPLEEQRAASAALALLSEEEYRTRAVHDTNRRREKELLKEEAKRQKAAAAAAGGSGAASAK